MIGKYENKINEPTKPSFQASYEDVCNSNRGGMVVSRVFLYHPSLVQAVFSVGTPYLPPLAVWEEFETMVQSKPNFRYQRQLGSPEFEAGFESKDSIRRFFNAAYGGRGPNGELGFSTSRALTENWGILSKGTQLSDKVLIFSANCLNSIAGIHGGNRSLIITLSSMRVMECMALVGVTKPLSLP